MNNYKKLSIAFSFFILLFYGEIAINIACGPEPDPYDYYVSYFHNDIQGDTYAAFSFTDLSFLYSEDEPQKESQINCDEWAQYLGGDVKATDVFSVMYRADNKTDSLISAWRTKKSITLPDTLKDNTFLQAIAKHKSAFDYYLFAKDCEEASAYAYDMWDPAPRDTTSMDSLAEKAIKRLKKVKRDEFLRLRYAYQAARMYHYSARYEKCLAVYEDYIEPLSYRSAVRGWALALKAGALRWLGDKEQAAFLFSKVFESNPERRIQAYKNYHYIDVSTPSVLALAKSKEEQAVIWSIEGFNNPSLNLHTLDTVYKLAPTSVLNGVLLIREMSKLEGYLNESPLSNDVYGYRNYYYGSDSLQLKAKSYADSLFRFSLHLASDKKYREPAFATIAAAYISWMQGENKRAFDLLQQLNPEHLSPKLQDQYRITELLVQASNIKKGDNFNPNALVPALKWLDEKCIVERKDKVDSFYGQKDLRFSRTTRHFYQSLLAPKYLALQDTAMAAILMVKGDLEWNHSHTRDSLFKYSSSETINFWRQQLTPTSLLRIKTLKENTPKDGLTEYLVKVLPALPNDDYYELLGTGYLRTHEYDKAVAAFDKLSPNYKFWVASDWYGSSEDAALHADPFLTTINDYPKAYADRGLNKKEFAEQMAMWQRKIKSNPKNAAKYYFAMANGVYQTGIFGNSWYLISYSWSHLDAYVSGTNYYDDDYKHAKQAIIWYEKARSLSKDVNFKATCTFMLAKCEQKKYGYRSVNDYYSSHNYGEPDPLWLFSMKNKYFVELEKYYKGTVFYNQALGECSYLSDFISARSK